MLFGIVAPLLFRITYKLAQIATLWFFRSLDDEGDERGKTTMSFGSQGRGHSAPLKEKPPTSSRLRKNHIMGKITAPLRVQVRFVQKNEPHPDRMTGFQN